MNKAISWIVRMLIPLLISCFVFAGTAFAQSDEDSDDTETMQSQLSEGYAGTEEDVLDDNDNNESGENASGSARTDKGDSNDSDASTGITAHDIYYDDTTNRQFIIVEDRDGNVFYLIIDYDVPVDEGEEQYKTYFLNPVNTEDLLSLAEINENDGVEEEIIVPVCTCNDKCKEGDVDTSCQVCIENYRSCAGTEADEIMDETEGLEASAEEESGGINSLAVLLVVVIIAGFGVLLYQKVIKDRLGGKTTSGSYEDEYEELKDGSYEEESNNTQNERDNLQDDLEIQYIDLDDEDEKE